MISRRLDGKFATSIILTTTNAFSSGRHVHMLSFAVCKWYVPQWQLEKSMFIRFSFSGNVLPKETENYVYIIGHTFPSLLN